MRLLFAITVCCCILLVGVAASLWRGIRRERAKGAEESSPAFADVMLEAARAQARGTAGPPGERQREPHPRMDLAAGAFFYPQQLVRNGPGVDETTGMHGEDGGRGRRRDPVDMAP